eukprot:7377209-Prymnesium_polylepis.1
MPTSPRRMPRPDMRIPRATGESTRLRMRRSWRPAHPDPPVMVREQAHNSLAWQPNTSRHHLACAPARALTCPTSGRGASAHRRPRRASRAFGRARAGRTPRRRTRCASAASAALRSERSLDRTGPFRRSCAPGPRATPSAEGGRTPPPAAAAQTAVPRPSGQTRERTTKTGTSCPAACTRPRRSCPD